MKFARSVKERELEKRIQFIVDLSRRRDAILLTAKLDLQALAELAADYEAANMPSAAADLRRRLDHYREKEMTKVL
jgi:hypothetical protein